VAGDNADPTAARAWFAANLAMLFLSAGFLTSGQPPAKRILFFLGALFWMPILGGLFVGQYGFPVLLGAALMIFALKSKNSVLTAIAAALLTFKPHLGGLVLVLSAVGLARRRVPSGRALVPHWPSGDPDCGGFILSLTGPWSTSAPDRLQGCPNAVSA
jgi:hypothetical protein